MRFTPPINEIYTNLLIIIHIHHAYREPTTLDLLTNAVTQLFVVVVVFGGGVQYGARRQLEGLLEKSD